MFVCNDVESNPVPCFDKRVWVLYSNIHGLHANLDELAGSDYDVLVCAKSKVLLPPSLKVPYPWLWLPPREAVELHSLCLGYGSFC